MPDITGWLYNAGISYCVEGGKGGSALTAAYLLVYNPRLAWRGLSGPQPLIVLHHKRQSSLSLFYN